MQKGYKREARGMAVLRCFIGVFIVIVVVLLAYFMLRVDYSDKLDPNASMRPYVEMTPTPVPTEVPAEAPVVIAESEATAEPVQVTVEPTDAATAEPTAEPTVEPTATPEPTPEPTATPEPTKIPESAISALKADGLELPPASTLSAQLAVTHSYRSAPDGYKLLHLKGYAYVDDPSYDAANSQLFLVIMQSSGKFIAAKPAMVPGASGADHAAAKCANASASDFEVVIDVSKFPDEIYSLGAVMMYESAGEKHIEYFTFPSDITFTVLNKQVISDIRIPTAE